MAKIIDEVADRLKSKGISPSFEEEDGLTVMKWKTRKSSYTFYFDNKGDVAKAQIDRYKMYPGFSDSGAAWAVRGGFGDVSRFFTFSKWLGMELFTRESLSKVQRQYDHYRWGIRQY